MNGTRRYNIPMFGVKHWYEHEMEAVGHLASMEDAYLRRMYASKVVNGMNHLTKAIDEKVVDPGYEHKKRDLELMKAGILRTMEHLKKDYDVTEGNISYKWNTGASSTLPSETMSPMSMPPMSMPSSFEPSMNTPPSFNENTLSLNNEPMSFDEDEPVLTLNNMTNFATAKTNSLNNNAMSLNTAALNLNNANKNVPNPNNNANKNANRNVLANVNNGAMNLNNNALANVNKNKNKNKNTLVGGRRRKHKKARHTRRR